jgi:hypothetical protein
MKYIISLLVIAGAVYFLSHRSNDLKNELQETEGPSFGVNETSDVKSAPKVQTQVKQNSPTAEPRQVASVPANAAPMDVERKLLKDLLATSHAANSKPELREKARGIRQQLMDSGNAEAVLWEHYESLRQANSSPYERVEVLDLLLSDKQNQKLADIALAEALSVQIADQKRPEQAKNQKELNEAMTTSPEMIPPIVAFDIYLKSCGPYSNCSQGAIAMIGSNSNHNLRANLISSLYSRFPQDRERIRTDLAKYDIK